MSRLLLRRTLVELQPGDVVEIQDAWFRLRYIRENRGHTTLHFQPEDEPLSPLVENDVVFLTVSDELALGFNVAVRP